MSKPAFKACAALNPVCEFKVLGCSVESLHVTPGLCVGRAICGTVCFLLFQKEARYE